MRGKHKKNVVVFADAVHNSNIATLISSGGKISVLFKEKVDQIALEDLNNLVGILNSLVDQSPIDEPELPGEIMPVVKGDNSDIVKHAPKAAKGFVGGVMKGIEHLDKTGQLSPKEKAAINSIFGNLRKLLSGK